MQPSSHRWDYRTRRERTLTRNADWAKQYDALEKVYLEYQESGAPLGAEGTTEQGWWPLQTIDFYGMILLPVCIIPANGSKTVL